MQAAASRPDWADLRPETCGMVFVLLGASSAMGPLEFLLSLGAHVVAVDIDRKVTAFQPTGSHHYSEARN